MGSIHDALSATRDTGYTTTQKMIQVMRDKGLVACDDSVRPPLYEAAESQEQTQLRILDDLAQKVFGGSARKLLMSLVSAKRVTAEELGEMQRLLRDAEGGER